MVYYSVWQVVCKHASGKFFKPVLFASLMCAPPVWRTIKPFSTITTSFWQIVLFCSMRRDPAFGRRTSCRPNPDMLKHQLARNLRRKQWNGSEPKSKRYCRMQFFSTFAVACLFDCVRARRWSHRFSVSQDLPHLLHLGFEQGLLDVVALFPWATAASMEDLI